MPHQGECGLTARQFVLGLYLMKVSGTPSAHRRGHNLLPKVLSYNSLTERHLFVDHPEARVITKWRNIRRFAFRMFAAILWDQQASPASLPNCHLPENMRCAKISR